MRKVFNKALAGVTSATLIATLALGVNFTSTVKADGATTVDTVWSFTQGGQYNPDEPGNTGYIKSVNVGNDVFSNWGRDKNEKQTQTASKATTGFTLDIEMQLKTEVADIMTQEAGIIRNKSGLQEGLNRLEALKAKENFEANEYYSLVSKNLLTVAELIIRSALFREESRGGHFRSDYPNPEDAFVCHIIQQKKKEIRTLPVQLKMENE